MKSRFLLSLVALATLLSNELSADASRTGPNRFIMESALPSSSMAGSAGHDKYLQDQKFNEFLNMMEEASFSRETMVTPTSVNCIEGGCDLHRNGVLVSFNRGQFPQTANGFQFDFNSALNSEFLTETDKLTITKTNNFVPNFIKFVMMKHFYIEPDKLTHKYGNTATLNLIVPNDFYDDFKKKNATNLSNFLKNIGVTNKDVWVLKSEVVPASAMRTVPVPDGFGKTHAEIFTYTGFTLQNMSQSNPAQFDEYVKEYFSFVKSKGVYADQKLYNKVKDFVGSTKQWYNLNQKTGKVEDVDLNTILKLIQQDELLTIHLHLNEETCIEKGAKKGMAKNQITCNKEIETKADLISLGILYINSKAAMDDFILCKNKATCEDTIKIKDRYFPSIIGKVRDLN